MDTEVKNALIKVKQTSVPVEDYDRALKFYTEKLGFVVEVDQIFGEEEGRVLRWIELGSGSGDARLVLHTPKEHFDRIGTFSNIMFHAEDMDKTYKEMVEKGIEFVMVPTKEQWGTFAIFKDSEGNTFCLSDA